MRLFESRLTRRILTIGGLLVASVVSLVLSPVLLIGAYLADVIRSDSARPRVRVVLLVFGIMLVELGAMVISLTHWVSTGFGLANRHEWAWHHHRYLIGWYTNALLAVITRVLGTTIDWRDSADLSSGPVVVIARHTSFFDALIPATLLCRRNKLLAHHVVTHGLRFSPCIDVVGHRFPNEFIKRTPQQGSEELASITELGNALGERSGCIIFPESTFRTPDRFARSIQRLEERAPRLVADAKSLRHVLPPRPSGTVALLAGAPDADLVVCANTGFEDFGSMREILRSPVSRRPIVIETWRIDRSTIPDEFDEFSDWLLAEYARIDEWVEQRHSALDSEARA